MYRRSIDAFESKFKFEFRNLHFAILLGALLFALSSSVHAQKPKNVPRIGYLSVLSPSSDATRNEAFRQGLRELGYVDGHNIYIEPRYAEGELARLPDLAGELVRLKVDIVVAGGSTAIRAIKNATSSIPIVMAHGSDLLNLDTWRAWQDLAAISLA
jgi:putative ABC transport system substrate-binding protein